jgi:hypothetical protein
MQGVEGGLAGNYIHCDELQSEFELYLTQRYSQTPDRGKVIAEAIIQQFRERNFILSLYGANIYGFVHRAFLEYFCASSFVWKFEKTKEFDIERLKTCVYGKHWKDQSWHEVLRLICGMIDEKWVSETINYLIDLTYKEIEEFILRTKDEIFNYIITRVPRKIALPAECLSDVTNLNAMMETVIRFLQHDKWQARYDILIVITEHSLKYSEILPFLRECAMKDFNSNVRKAAVSALIKHFRNDAQTLPLLSDRATNDTDSDVRCSAVSALAEHYRDDAQTLPLVRDRAMKDESPKIEARESMDGVRKNAIEAITKYWPDHPDTLSLLEDRAKNDPTPWLRERARALIKELTEKKQKA